MDQQADGFAIRDPIFVGMAAPDLVMITRRHDDDVAPSRSPDAPGGGRVIIQHKPMHVVRGARVCRVFRGVKVPEPLALPNRPHAVRVGIGERVHDSTAPAPRNRGVQPVVRVLDAPLTTVPAVAFKVAEPVNPGRPSIAASGIPVREVWQGGIGVGGVRGCGRGVRGCGCCGLWDGWDTPPKKKQCEQKQNTLTP